MILALWQCSNSFVPFPNQQKRKRWTPRCEGFHRFLADYILLARGQRQVDYFSGNITT